MATPNLPSVKIVEPDASLWGSSLQPAGCTQCGQAHLVEPARLGQPCPSCGRGRLAPQPARLRPEPPELQAPFLKTGSALLPIFQRFTSPIWLRPDDFNPESLTRKAVPVYWPAWLVDSDVSGAWQAEVGYDYQVQSSQETYGGSGWQSRPLVETRIRWEPRAGELSRHYDNITAPAASDQARLLSLLGEYLPGQARPFDARELAPQPGSHETPVVRVPDLPPESAWPLAKDRLDQAVSMECCQAARGQHIRSFRLQAEYRSLHWTQLLLPMYVTFYTDDAGQVHPVYINGQTGTIGGLRLASQKKGWRLAGILVAVALGLFLLGLLGIALGPVASALSVAGMVFIALAFVAGLAALVPAIYPWQWNRTQTIPPPLQPSASAPERLPPPG